MVEYQVLARKYRPQYFKDVVGQKTLIETLINAIRFKRLAHAYLFCGSRGTGKTTIARIFAKAINCPNRGPDFEPCNECSSCKEVTSGISLDVIEIDGASHRGIDDIRQINETVGYSPPAGKYKIYLIDEVHMLTKEAFNALLKTLEEPPPAVKFFFATTEPHKVPATILSRCQRFQLNRISAEKIVDKLQAISQDLSLTSDIEALHLIANASEGSLRDAESLFDQIISFQGDSITAGSVRDSLGLMPRESFFALDEAFGGNRLNAAFEISRQVYLKGKDISFFIESLIEHFRTHLLIKLNEPTETQLNQKDREEYERWNALYSTRQCLTILDILIESQQQMKSAPSLQIALEATLLKILRTKMHLSAEELVSRLMELEHRISSPTPPQSIRKPQLDSSLPQKMNLKPEMSTPPAPQPPAPPNPQPNLPPELPQQPTPSPSEVPLQPPAPPIPQPILPPELPKQPTPSPSEIPQPAPPKEAPKAQHIASITEKGHTANHQARYDTLMRFAAVELEGTLKKK